MRPAKSGVLKWAVFRRRRVDGVGAMKGDGFINVQMETSGNAAPFDFAQRLGTQNALQTRTVALAPIGRND
jgi:hypothetical protein